MEQKILRSKNTSYDDTRPNFESKFNVSNEKKLLREKFISVKYSDIRDINENGLTDEEILELAAQVLFDMNRVTLARELRTIKNKSVSSNKPGLKLANNN